MKKHWILVACLALMTRSQAQDSTFNWVYNPSFEEHTECPKKIDALGVLTIVDGWYQPTSGSADYYNTCGSKECRVPKNKLGIQESHSGNGYCGLYCSKTDYREYLQTQLRMPLIEGRKYRLTFYTSLSEYSPHIIATIGGLFTKDRISDTTFGVIMKKEIRKVSGSISQTIATYLEPQVVNPKERLLDNTTEWMKVSGDFIANGGERFLTIGNFYPATASNFIERNGDFLLPGAYYYLDDVSLICLDCQTTNSLSDTNSPQSDNIINEPTYHIGSTIILHDLYFDFDKSTLLQQSYNELKHLVDLLIQYPKMKIEISGHTDNLGTAEYNQRLSENRARAVTNYLIDRGISGNRLSYVGYGKSRPIASNDTEEGRATNRRVEVRITDL